MADSIYKTPDEYMLLAIDRVRQLGSKLTDFTVGSRARTLFEAQAVMHSEQSAVAEQLRQDSYLATAVGEALDRKAADNQVARKAAVPAAGTITIVRPTPGAAVSIPAGWSQLQTVPAPGSDPIAFVTTEDAVFEAADTSQTVAAQAVDGGVAGNIADETVLLPVNPVGGFQTQGGFMAGSAFSGGVDRESDDALRARIPIAVQGRVLGRKASFLAAALSVPGVESAYVLQPGDTRGAGTVVPANTIEVQYEGVAGLLTAVSSAVTNAAVAGQAPSAFTAAAEPCVADLVVFCQAGVDTAALAVAVRTAVIAVGNSFGVGQTVRASALIQAVHDVANVVSVDIPFNDLRLASDVDGTFGDITIRNDRYAGFAAADVAVTVTELS